MFEPNHLSKRERSSPNQLANAICGIVGGVLYIFLSEKCAWKDESIGKWLHYLSPLFTMVTGIACPWIARKIYCWYLQYHIAKYSARMSVHISQAADRQAISGDHEDYLKSQRFHADKTLIETYRALLDSTNAKFRKHFGTPEDGANDDL